MALKVPTFMSPQEYLEFEEASPTKHEYVDGILHEMPGESIDNNEVAGNIYTALRPSARNNQCRIAIEGVKLWIPRFNRYYYPDVMVLCDPRDKDPKNFGSGSKLTDTSEVIVHDKTFENNLVHDIRFRER
jgi:Uma2 family endonuclease